MMNEVLAGRRPVGNVVCDLDGVIYVMSEPVPGADRALSELAAMGHSLLFVTNNSTRPPGAVAAKIRELTGYPARPEQVIGSAAAAASLLGTEAGPVLVVGGDGIHRALHDIGISWTDDPRKAEAVIVGLDLRVSYERLRDALVAIERGARFIATNTDPTFPAPDGLWPGAGAIVAAVQTATGVQPEIAGKPHEAIRGLITDRLVAGPTWVVGDRPETDLAMARAEGWGAVLVLSGVTADGDTVPAQYRPDFVLESIADLPEALQS
jgi:4-nitrophenyl phosphatase